jgi:hypothetical protein
MRFLRAALMLAAAGIALHESALALGPADNSVQASKLTPLIGAWTCSDTGSSKPYSASVKAQGKWIVWRDTGEDANTIYVRFNPSMQAYVVANVDAEGDVEVSTTKARDPLNGTWYVQFPTHTSGPTFTLSYSAYTFTLARPYVNQSGKRVVARLLCHKRR